MFATFNKAKAASGLNFTKKNNQPSTETTVPTAPTVAPATPNKVVQNDHFIPSPFKSISRRLGITNSNTTQNNKPGIENPLNPNNTGKTPDQIRDDNNDTMMKITDAVSGNNKSTVNLDSVHNPTGINTDNVANAAKDMFDGWGGRRYKTRNSKRKSRRKSKRKSRRSRR